MRFGLSEMTLFTGEGNACLVSIFNEKLVNNWATILVIVQRPFGSPIAKTIYPHPRPRLDS